MFPKISFLGFHCLFFLSSCYQAQEDTSPQIQIPVSLVGEWLDEWSFQNSYPLNTRLFNEHTSLWFSGAYDPWSMDPRPGFGLKIYPDGKFIWTQAVSSGQGGCQSYVVEFLKGSLEATASTMVFKPNIRRRKYHSACNPSLDFDRNESTDSFQMDYVYLEQALGNGQLYMTLTLQDSEGGLQTLQAIDSN